MSKPHWWAWSKGCRATLARAALLSTTCSRASGYELNAAESEFAKKLKQFMALPCYGKADEIASMVAYVAGREASFVTGARLTIDGGFNA